MNPLDIFDGCTKLWFESALGSPTAVQREAWPAIAAGGHTLVSAPTGTGKTLSAFLVFIDRLRAQARAGTLKNELQLVYISPLKALAGDIRENLRKPLDGVFSVEHAAGVSAAESGIAVGLRTGDTTAAERRHMIKSPPHILITTPESLYLLLSSASGRSMLRTARAVIVDELHALIDSKRGAHMMLSLARLDALCGKPLQRIGLSATIAPLSLAAEYLAGASPSFAGASPSSEVTVVAPVMKKDIEIAVTSPLANMHILPQGTVWPELAKAVYAQCMGARSVLAFVEGRLQAEKLAFYVNEIAGEGFARTHHGCVSKEQRLEAEDDLRNGRLRLLCATSSMELGIDVGDIDRVVQIGYPRSISSLMQRLGRAGHNPGRVSVMHMFPRTASEGLYCGMTARVAETGGIECLRAPRMCLDVLAQHLVSLAANDSYTVDDIMKILSRAQPFRDVTRDDVKSLLEMLAGDYEHKREIPVRPRLLYDRINERVEGDAYSRLLAVSSGGTIPDTGMFSVRLDDGTKLGELDEEFVFEARVGDKFLLGSFAWKIARMDRDTVTVTPTTPEGAQPPFWKNGLQSRRLQTGLAFGELLRELDGADGSQALKTILAGYGLDKAAAVNAAEFLLRQKEATGILPNDRAVIVEHFTDDAGDGQVMIHSVFGRPVNAPLALLLQTEARRVTGLDINCYDDDDGILMMAASKGTLPDGLLRALDPEGARAVLEALLPSTPLFGMAFRYNAARSLMMGVRKAGRLPLWIQRLRGAQLLDSVIDFPDHPLIRESKRECLEDYWDLDGLESVLREIRSGAIAVRELYTPEPSPMSLPLRRQAEGELLYAYTPSTTNIRRASAEALDALRHGKDLLKPDAGQLERFSERRKLPEDERQLHTLLMTEGDLAAGELNIPVEWLEALASAGRALYIEPGLWIAAEHAGEYEAALEQDGTGANEEEQLHIVRRALRYRGAQDAGAIAERYFWTEAKAAAVLNKLFQSESAVEYNGLFYHADIYERAARETVAARRRQIKTAPPERYAAMLASRVRAAAPPVEQLERALNSLCGRAFPPAVWEGALLPLRVNAYRPALLDTLLAAGDFFWNITESEGRFELSFHRYDGIDWDAPPASDGLAGDGQIIYNTLLKRGASFAAALNSQTEGRSVHDALLSLAEKGLIHADSFAPVRQWLDREKTRKNNSARRRVSARVATLTAGRWDISRGMAELSMEARLERAFDKAVILCRETAREIGLAWSEALETLRVWEYTGRVRRGYFVAGLSGAQYIAEKDFVRAAAALEEARDELVWLPATDPAQPWGRILAHLPGREFICVAGTAVALRAGLPVAVFERQGQQLRVFDCGGEALEAALRAFAKEYAGRRIFSGAKRLTVRQYPEEAAEALANAGFTRVMEDFALYQDYL